MFFSWASNAAVSCDELFSTPNIDAHKEMQQALQILYRRPLSDVVPMQDIHLLLKQMPQFLLETEPPAGQKLKTILDSIPVEEARSFFGQNLRLLSIGTIDIKSSITDLLRSEFTYKGHYYFIGNGMSPVHRIVEFLFAETSLSHRVHPLKASRMLFDKPNFSQKKLFQYFEILGWGPEFPGKIVLIDSMGRSKGERHSILVLKTHIVSFLVSKGMNKTEAMKKVVPVGISEGEPLRGRFVIDGHEENVVTAFEKAVSQYSKLDERARADQVQPFIFTRALSFNVIKAIHEKAPRWQHDESKFSTFGKDGVPTIAGDVIQTPLGENDGRHWGYRVSLRTRIGHLYYLKLVQEYWDQAKQEPEILNLLAEVERRIGDPR